MAYGLILLILFFILLVLLVGLSIGLAFLLHWLLPAVGLEWALLIAVIAVGQAMLIFGRILHSAPPIDAESESEPPIVILDQAMPLPRRRRRR